VHFENLSEFLVGNGYIPTSCLKEILKELDGQLTNEELDMMIEEIDSDGSGTVDFDGMLFKQMIASKVLRTVSFFLFQNFWR
jgi:Ca2+-binding EF-hand superfamily protein